MSIPSSAWRSDCWSRARHTIAAPNVSSGRLGFLVAAFREFERRSAAAGVDEWGLRRELLTTPAVRPWRHIVLTVTDRAFDANGLMPADWDLLARLPGLTRLDVLVTDGVIAGALHEKIHTLLPGIEEVRVNRATAPRPPILLIPGSGGVVHTARDREEEVAGVRQAREARGAASRGRSARPGCAGRPAAASVRLRGA